MLMTSRREVGVQAALPSSEYMQNYKRVLHRDTLVHGDCRCTNLLCFSSVVLLVYCIFVSLLWYQYIKFDQQQPTPIPGIYDPIAQLCPTTHIVPHFHQTRTAIFSRHFSWICFLVRYVPNLVLALYPYPT